MTAALAVEIAGPVLGSEMPVSWREVADQTHEYRSLVHSSLWFAALRGDEVLAVGAVDLGAGWVGPSLVLPEARGQGLQRRLLEARLDLARQRGVPSLQTAVDLTNTASLRNVLRAGFQVEEYEEDEDHFLLRWEHDDESGTPACAGVE